MTELWLAGASCCLQGSILSSMPSMSCNSVLPSPSAPLSPSESNVSMEPPPFFTEQARLLCSDPLAQEDEFLRELVKRHGTKKWHIISAKMNNKTPRECRKRWRTYLHLCMNKSSWSSEEDRLLLEGHSAYGNRWTEIAKMVPGRTDNAVKNRYNALCKKRLHRSAKSVSGTPIELSDEGDLTRELKRSKKPTRTKDRDGSCSSNVTANPAAWGRHGLSIEIPGDYENTCKCGGGSRKPLTTINGADPSHLQEVDMEEVMGWLLVRTPTPTCKGSRYSNSTVTSSTSTSPTPPQDMSNSTFSQSCSHVTSSCKDSSTSISPAYVDDQGAGELSTYGGSNQLTMKDMEELVFMLQTDSTMRPSMRNCLDEHGSEKSLAASQ